MLKWLWRLFLLTLLSGLLVSSLLFFALYHTYERLTDEAPVAWLRFDKLGEQHYQLHLRTTDQCQERSFPIKGDDWRLDARFIKWPHWLTLMGFEPQYRLERVEGRYRNIQQSNDLPHKAYALSPQTWVQPQWLDTLSFLVDTEFGSSTYAPMDKGQDYVVYRSNSGLFARAQEKAATLEPLALTASRPCQLPQSYWTQAALWLDRQARTLAQQPAE
ncbi:hypothetical protein [Gallaecimonas xiamenensis]|uniref:Uncharacterized protein n=1 Tax=Gallaecimonas xiamenensis 3-C-1 TaxID=745411 RepID=K2JLJ4_9GAMM|nr:hypothetical protein [Gallaecimonas xiamenensis]EKE76163.1 hypothetical protein B3C1_04625 [Gallaecimonas xiamenensis 3-C-1]